MKTKRDETGKEWKARMAALAGAVNLAACRKCGSTGAHRATCPIVTLAPKGSKQSCQTSR